MTVDLSSARSTLASARALRAHPATNGRLFRWWLALPVVAILVVAFRDEVHSVVHLVLDMPEPAGHHAVAAPPPSADRVVGALDSANRVLDALAKLLAKAGGVVAAASWLWLRQKPKGPRE